MTDQIYRRSLDDRLTRYESGKNLDGKIWGLNWSLLYPGWAMHMSSAKAAHWTERLGITFHGTEVEGDAYNITLVFADLVVTKIPDHISPDINSIYILCPPGTSIDQSFDRP
jgi:hypothetical protein